MLKGEDYYREYINGNDHAFEQIMRLYYDGLVLFVNGYLFSISDAEEVASECFLYIAIHKKKYNFTTSLKTFLYMLGRSKALNFLKKRKRFKTENIDDYIHLYSDKTDVEMIIERDEKNVNLYKAINILSEEMKNAVYLFYFENLSYEEIAKIMKKNVKQIDNLLYRAKKNLFEIINKEDV